MFKKQRYQTAKGIIPESLKSIGQYMPIFKKRANRYIGTDAPTLITEKFCF